METSTELDGLAAPRGHALSVSFPNMTSEYERQFSPVDPELCELIYEANRHFRTLRRRHEYEHTPLGVNKGTLDGGDDGDQHLPFLKKLMRRSASTDRLSQGNYYHPKKHSRRSKSADRSLMYQKYSDRKAIEEPKLSRMNAKTEGQERPNCGKPKIRIKLPPFVAYGSGSSSREIGDLKTHNVHATHQTQTQGHKTVTSSHPSLLNGVMRADRLMPLESANRARSSPSPSPDADRSSRRMDTATWQSKVSSADWKTEYSSNFCS
ncbi:uncharacterized protein LOC115217489 [Argonauta hians]